MYVDKSRRAAALMFFVLLRAASAAAQGMDPHAGHNMAGMEQAMPESREGSGTSWLPDESPMRAIHVEKNGWMLMTHFNAFVQHLHESGDRGSLQTGSTNWLMGMAKHPAGAGTFMVRGMVSAEPWTIGGCGYPDLLATGETCDGAAIHDRQHPHDLFMELAAHYDHPIAKGLHLQLYGGPVGEPALGPVAFMHRVSAFSNPLAPITHHWFDSSHITFGVATAGLYGTRWKIEGSAFNGREPDEHRTGIDLAAMDSYSARLSISPAPRWSMQISGGRLHEVEPGHQGEPAIDVDRVTASATYHRSLSSAGLWASTIAWGRNAERFGAATNAVFVETNLSPDGRNTIFGRFEVVAKTAHDLALSGDEIFTVAKVQGGYTRYFMKWKSVLGGVGAGASIGIVPRGLAASYGRRGNPGGNVYLTLTPAAMHH